MSHISKSILFLYSFLSGAESTVSPNEIDSWRQTLSKIYRIHRDTLGDPSCASSGVAVQSVVFIYGIIIMEFVFKKK